MWGEGGWIGRMEKGGEGERGRGVEGGWIGRRLG